MKQTVVTLALLTMAFFTNASHAELINIEEAIESQKAELLLQAPGKGYVLVHDCQGCPLKFAIDGNTHATRGKETLPLDAAREQMRRGVTVFFDPKTRVVTRLGLW